MSDLAPFLNLVRNRITVSEIVGIDVRLTRKGRGFSGLCPFHPEKTPSFTVNDEKGFYHCFGCGAHGDLLDYLTNKQNLPFMEAIEFLSEKTGIPLPKKTNTNDSKPKTDPSLYQVVEAACVWFEQQLSLNSGEVAREYLAARKITAKTTSQFRLGYAPSKKQGLKEALEAQGFSLSLIMTAGLVIQPEDGRPAYDRFRGRIIFPIWDSKGKVIAFGGRILQEGEPKYLNSPETPIFSKSHTLYGYHYALPAARADNSYLLVEGYLDVISLHQAGWTSAVAPLGTALTPEQMALMWKTCREPILCFDGDNAGLSAAKRGAHRALPFLKSNQSLQFCFLAPGDDPDSLVRSGQQDVFKKLVSSPQKLVDVLWDILTKEKSINTPEAKASLKHDINTTLKEIADSEIRYFYQADFENRFKKLWFEQTVSPERRNKVTTPPPSQRVRPKQQVSEQKDLKQKILLVTLINHPTLIAEVAEQLINLRIENSEWKFLPEKLIEISNKTTEISAAYMISELEQQGFGNILSGLLTADLYLCASFAHSSEDSEKALLGWKELWSMTELKSQLNLQVSLAEEELRSNFNDESWQRLKNLKTENLKTT